MGRVLAVDYGSKRVGIAVTDELQLIANPLTTVHAKDIFSFLHDYISREPVDCIVVGEPRQMNNTPSESVLFIDPFVKRLRKEFPDIKVERVDERFTSLMATKSIRESGVNRKRRQDKALIDTISATLILQSYMEGRDFIRNH
ncbi:MAG TPA: Holliday junction resolvase RuvX [Bacteroidales bacterium]|jgi:putative holliday junction resolvase